MTKQMDYALQFLAALYNMPQKGVLSVRAFSTESTISFLFLQRTAKVLREAGIIKAIKGPRGGYVLARDASDISLKDIVEAVDGPYNTVACQVSPDACPQFSSCTSQSLFHKVEARMVGELSNMKLIELV